MTSTDIRRSSRCTPTPPYLFIGAVAFTAGALTSRTSFSFTTNQNVETPHRRTSSRATFPAMFGGGDGVHVPSRGNATAALIFMHGLGDTGAGWASSFPLRGLDYLRVILPTAPTQPVSLNMGYKSSSWFDLHGLDRNSREDRRGILNSMARINTIIDNQIAQGIPSRRIIVAGFSQGGALALTTALRSPRKLAGVVALSAWLPLRSQYPAQMTSHAADAEMFIAHGTADQVVDFKFGQRSAEYVKTLVPRVTFQSYPGLTHSASPQELDDMRQFISRIVPQV